MARLEDYVRFSNEKLARRWKGRRVPMTKLYEAYFDGELDIVGDINAFMEHRNELVSQKLVVDHFKWLLTNFLPEALIHSKEQDKRIVREHYDRGNDFFGWFLGETMVYTSGFFRHADETLEEAQTNKLDLVCQKLQLKPGDRLLDIGCGWGTLTRHAAKYYGADAVGVTLSKEQTEFGNKRIQDWGLGDRARILCLDYRDIPKEKFDKIVSLEMVEHVGVKNLKAFYDQVFTLLKDEGLFLLQWTGLRRGFSGEDLIWILFMGKYIFPGADASLCPSAMLKAMEKSKFEMHSVENVTNHYGHTIAHWQKNWESNREAILEAYGERWFRLWNFFLAWSVHIANSGSAACFQVVLNKNLDEYDRGRWVADNAVNLGDRLKDLERRPDVSASQPPSQVLPAGLGASDATAREARPVTANS